MDHDEERRRDEFGTARVAAALALILAIVLMLVVDMFSTDYEPDPIVVTTVLGAAAALLGVEIIDFVQRKGK